MIQATHDLPFHPRPAQGVFGGHRAASRTSAKLISLAIILGATASLGACAQTGAAVALLTGQETAASGSDATATQTADKAKPSPQEVQQTLIYWSQKFAANPGDETTAITYANNLRYIDHDDKAYSVLVRATMANPNSKALLGEQGRLALSRGDTAGAKKLLDRAFDPSRPDWRVLSARGVAEAQLGQLDAAVATLTKAAEIDPNNPKIANNLALALALKGDATSAKTVLRGTAIADASSEAGTKIKENLALLERLSGEPGTQGAGAGLSGWQTVSAVQ